MSDLISRQAVLEEIDRVSRKYSASFFKGLSIAADIVAKQPSAERPKGKWKHEHLCSTSGGTYEVVRCSECAWQYPMTATNYCPHCGAEMEREE